MCSPSTQRAACASLLRRARRIRIVEVERDPDLGLGRRAPQDLDGAAVREQQVVRGRERVRVGRAARRVVAPAVADPRDDPRLVVRDPVPDAVAEPSCDGLDVLRERVDGVADGPAARVLERLRRVPVEERHVRRDAVAEQLVDQPVVEVEARCVDAPRARRDDARPGDREAERVEAELAHQRDVVAVAVVEVARDRAGVAVPHLAGRRAEAVPDALAAAVLVGRAFDLVRRGRRAPDEVGREAIYAVGLAWSSSRMAGDGCGDVAAGAVRRARPRRARA